MNNLNMLVPYYLMASYLYYIEDKSVFADELFDELCSDLLKNWDIVEHRHKYLIKKEYLNQGTGYYLKETDYPFIVQHAAKLFYEKRSE